MKTLAITVTSKKQELLFINLADELGVEITQAKFKPLSTKNIVTGIGRKFSDAELSEYLERTKRGKAKHAGMVKHNLKTRLAGK